MGDLNKQVRNRLGIEHDKIIEFKDLDDVIERMAKTIPFENLSVINNLPSDITVDNLSEKILNLNEGGLCYELNTLLFYFLKENEFDVKLIRCMRYDYANRSWSALGKTHVATLINHKGQLYLFDVGFGGLSPLKVVPLNGDEVTSANGKFKVINVSSGYGDFLFCMKVRYKHTEWNMGYAFDTKESIQEIAELEEVRKLIFDHPGSNFNKKLLVSKFTDTGSITLTDTSLTEWVNGDMRKVEINDPEVFLELAKRHFGLNTRKTKQDVR